MVPTQKHSKVENKANSTIELSKHV